MTLKADMHSSDSALLERRRIAAAASGGESNGVYESFESLIPRLGLSGDLLDFGAGAGYLARALQATSCFRTIKTVDILKPTIDLPPSIASTTCDLNGPTPFQDGSFDSIVSAEVIEHLENPRAVAREWFRLLRPSGGLLLSTPNNESWRAMIGLVARGHFVMFGESSYPAHITALVRMDLARILREAGFSEIQFYFTDLGGIPGRPSWRWQSLSRRAFRGLRFSDNVLAFARKPE